jgi:REP-associated tyrosine transposase
MVEKNSPNQHRRSTRMKGYDYSLAGAYFITVATYQRSIIFGEVVNGEVKLNQYGNVAFQQWIRLGKRFKDSNFPTFIIMPNHIHAVVCIVRGAGVEFNHEFSGNLPLRPYKIPITTPGSLGVIVRAYKASVTYRINALRGKTEPPIWQRNYYDHIVRNEKEYEHIWKHIETNPINCSGDHLTPFPANVQL